MEWKQAHLTSCLPYAPPSNSIVSLMRLQTYSYLYWIALCVTSISNEGKMRPLQFGFYNIINWCRKLKLRKNFNFHDVLLSYQPIRTADPAWLGQISRADWLVTQKDIVQCGFFSWIWLSMINSDNMKAKLERTHFSIICNWGRTMCAVKHFYCC